MMQERRIDKLELKMPDGQMLRGDFHYTPPTLPDLNAEPSPVVVFAHGFGSVRNGDKALAVADECARRGWAFATCDFRGHGESDGKMIELLGSRLIEDLDAITGEAARRARGKLFLFGSSMGGWASAWFAARYPGRVAACAFVAPAFCFIEFMRLTDAEREAWQRAGRHRFRNEFVDVEIGYGLAAEAEWFKFGTLAKQFRTPSIIFHGTADDIVPHSISVEFAERCAAEIDLNLIEFGDHRLNEQKDKLARAACDFFNIECD
ncbi:MAG: alpha/beta fold hydrolase [Acidobacteriota bacterium]